MKKIILIAFTALLSVMAYAQDKGIKFSSGTFTEIKAEAKKAKKFIFMDVYTTWCGPCKMLASDIFPDEYVGDYINSSFVSSKFDAEKGEGVSIAKTYNVKSYPTMLILDAEGNELTRLVGADRSPEAFVKRVKAAMAKVQK